MQVHVFRGPDRIFGFTEDAGGSNLPSRFAPWASFKTVELQRDGEPVRGVHTQECLDDIERYGYHVTDAHTRITETLI